MLLNGDFLYDDDDDDDDDDVDDDEDNNNKRKHNEDHQDNFSLDLMDMLEYELLSKNIERLSCLQN